MGDRSHKGRVPTAAAAMVAALLFTATPALAGEYTVKRGDTLSHIAARHDVPGGWPALFKLNSDVIDNPHLIYPGQVLTVDGNPKASEPKPRSSSADAEPAGIVRPATGRVTSSYGMRIHPVTGVYKLHSGIDYAYGDGRAYAAKAGRVVAAAWVSGYGNLVTISHGDAVRTRYAHLAQITVDVGERVDAGEVVGRIGSTGYSTGAHLHFEVLRNGEFVNPTAWLER